MKRRIGVRVRLSATSLALAALLAGGVTSPASAADNDAAKDGADGEVACSYRFDAASLDKPIEVKWSAPSDVDRVVVRRQIVNKFWWRGAATGAQTEFHDGPLPSDAVNVNYRVEVKRGGAIVGSADCDLISTQQCYTTREASGRYRLELSRAGDSVFTRQVSDGGRHYWRGRTPADVFSDGASWTGTASYRVAEKSDFYGRIVSLSDCVDTSTLDCRSWAITDYAPDGYLATSAPIKGFDGRYYFWATPERSTGSDYQVIASWHAQSGAREVVPAGDPVFGTSDRLSNGDTFYEAESKRYGRSGATQGPMRRWIVTAAGTRIDLPEPVRSSTGTTALIEPNGQRRIVFVTTEESVSQVWEYDLASRATKRLAKNVKGLGDTLIGSRVFGPSRYFELSDNTVRTPSRINRTLAATGLGTVSRVIDGGHGDLLVLMSESPQGFGDNLSLVLLDAETMETSILQQREGTTAHVGFIELAGQSVSERFETLSFREQRESDWSDRPLVYDRLHQTLRRIGTTPQASLPSPDGRISLAFEDQQDNGDEFFHSVWLDPVTMNFYEFQNFRYVDVGPRGEMLSQNLYGQRSIVEIDPTCV